MTLRKALIALGAMTLSAAAAFAALSPQMTDWGKSSAQFLMTKDEAAQWKSIQNDADAQKFIDLFWARRDPSPATPQNEYKERYEALVKYANEHFAQGKVAGSLTDRGKVFILFGPPSKVSRVRGDVAGDTGADAGALQEGQQSVPSETWYYEGDHIPAFLATAAPASKDPVMVTFTDQFSSGDFRITRSPRMSIPEALAKAAQSTIVSPDLKEVPKYAQAGAPKVIEKTIPASEIKVAAATDLTTESLKTAVTDFSTSGKSEAKPALVTWGSYITGDGRYFVPVQIYVPQNAGLGADAGLTFFGKVVDATGAPVAAYEEPATLSATKNDFYFDKSLELQPGKYSAVFGLAKDGKPVSISKTELDLPAIDKAAETTSQLILSNNIFPLSAAQKPMDPYAFGGMKVIPKGDKVFSKADELWYFLEIRNPGIDSTVTPPAPKLQVKVDLEGVIANGKKVKMAAPLAEVPAQELKGVPGHFAIGSSIPLSGFQAGDYTLKLKVIDSVSKQTYELQQGFKIAG